MKQRPIAAFLLMSILVVLLAGCSGCKGGRNGTGSEVVVGVVGPFDGPDAYIGKEIMNSVRLYFDQHKSDVPVKLIAIDTKSNPSDAVAAMQAVASKSDLVATIAFYHSSTALASKPIIQEAKLPSLIYSASDPKVTDNAPYYFRLVPTDDNQAIVLSGYAKVLGAKRAAILYYADEYGKGLADGIEANATADQFTVVSVKSYDSTTMDFRPELTIIKAQNPDVIFICGFVDKSVAILNQAAEEGLNSKFLAGDGTFNEEQLIAGAGRNAEGVYVAAPYVFDETNSKNMTFLEAYWNAYEKGGAQEKPASWTAFAYDAAGILDTAFRTNHRERASIEQFLRGMNSPQTGYDGITGVSYFNSKGDAVGRQFRLAVVKNQRFVAAR